MVSQAAVAPSSWKSYLELCKPNVVAEMLFTAVVGMLLAVPGMPPLDMLGFGLLGIALAAASATSPTRNASWMSRKPSRTAPTTSSSAGRSGMRRTRGPRPRPSSRLLPDCLPVDRGQLLLKGRPDVVQQGLLGCGDRVNAVGLEERDVLCNAVQKERHLFLEDALSPENPGSQEVDPFSFGSTRASIEPDRTRVAEDLPLVAREGSP